MLNIETLLDDGSEAGFVWESGEVQYEPTKGQKVSLGEAPHVRVTDVSLFEDNFPGVILASLNGTSIKVMCQGVTRRRLKNVKAGGGKRPTDAEMRPDVLNALRGTKNRATVIEREVEVFVYGGQTFATLEEAQAAEIATLVDLGVPADKARAKVLQGSNS